MRDVFENEETFIAYAEIDFCLFAIKEMSEVKGKPSKKHILDTIALMECIIKNKKILEADYSNTENAIKELKTLLPA